MWWAEEVVAGALIAAQEFQAEQQRQQWERLRRRPACLPYSPEAASAPVYRHTGNCANCGAPHEPVCSYCGTRGA